VCTLNDLGEEHGGVFPDSHGLGTQARVPGCHLVLEVARVVALVLQLEPQGRQLEDTRRSVQCLRWKNGREVHKELVGKHWGLKKISTCCSVLDEQLIRSPILARSDSFSLFSRLICWFRRWFRLPWNT
jgi:hypothetical protein